MSRCSPTLVHRPALIGKFEYLNMLWHRFWDELGMMGEDDAELLSPVLRESDLDATYMLHDGFHSLSPPSLRVAEPECSVPDPQHQQHQR